MAVLLTNYKNIMLVFTLIVFILWICEAKISEGKNADEENGMSLPYGEWKVIVFSFYVFCVKTSFYITLKKKTFSNWRTN